MTPGEIYNAKHLKAIEAITAPGQALEVREELIGGSSLPVFANAPDRLLELYQAAMEYGDRDFIVYGDERWSYQETLEQARRLAWAMWQEYNIRPGVRVAIACRNYPEWCITYLAITAIGAIVVPLNSWWKAEELEFAVEDSSPQLLFLDDQRADYLTSAMERSKIPGVVIRSDGERSPPFADWQGLLDNRPMGGWPDVTIDPDAPATLLYTSGSTGHPKGVLSTARAIITCLMTWAMLGTAAKLAEGRNPSEKDSHLGILACLPLFHITGCNSMFLMSMLQGRKIVFVDKWNVDQAMRLIESEQLTHFLGVPTMTYELLHSPDRSKYDLSSLEDIGAGGAARPAHLTKALDEAFEANIGIGYGMTETNALGTLIGKLIYQERPASVGQANSPIVAIRIHHEDVNDHAPNGAGANAIGEVCIRSAANMQEYWNNPAATKHSIKDGWFHTGDLGYLDDDGFLFLVDRKKDLIISGGENISPKEVENALMTIKGIENACVFSVPDERLGEVVGAQIQVSDETITRTAILGRLKDQLAHFKLPRFIWLEERALLVVGSGKTDKVTIRNTCLERLSEGRVS